jgi:hypothetical protein
MFRSSLIGLAALGVIAAAASAQGKMDCGAKYKAFLVKYHAGAGKAASHPADKVADMNRTALRAYEACTAGDEFNATNLFATLDSEAE